MPSRDLAPITNKRMHRTLRRVNDLGGATRAECWGAETVDGVWRFERLEEPGTPWAVTHVPSGLEVAWAPSLRSCRQMVTNAATVASLLAGARLVSDAAAVQL